jgi:hypothetical protein
MIFSGFPNLPASTVIIGEWSKINTLCEEHHSGITSIDLILSMFRGSVHTPLFIGFVLFYSVFTAGCFVSRPVYPSTWPSVAPQQPLSAFQGYYSSGIDTLIDGGNVSGNYEGRNPLALRVEEDLRIQLGFTDSIFSGQRTWRSYPTERPQRRISLRKNRNGVLIYYRSNNSGGNMLLGFDRLYCRMSMLTDGTLLIKKGNWYMGLLFLVVPVYGSDYEWIRISPTQIQVVSKNRNSGRRQ